MDVQEVLFLPLLPALSSFHVTWGISGHRSPIFGLAACQSENCFSLRGEGAGLSGADGRGRQARGRRPFSLSCSSPPLRRAPQPWAQQVGLPVSAPADPSPAGSRAESPFGPPSAPAVRLAVTEPNSGRACWDVTPSPQRDQVWALTRGGGDPRSGLQPDELGDGSGPGRQRGPLHTHLSTCTATNQVTSSCSVGETSQGVELWEHEGSCINLSRAFRTHAG